MRQNVQRRVAHGLLLLGLFAIAAVARCSPTPAHAECISAWVTGYVETGNPTADGTSTRGQAWSIVAAHPSVPFDSYVTISGLGVFRVADRGGLSVNHFDVLVNSVEEALDLTGTYPACIAR